MKATFVDHSIFIRSSCDYAQVFFKSQPDVIPSWKEGVLKDIKPCHLYVILLHLHKVIIVLGAVSLNRLWKVEWRASTLDKATRKLSFMLGETFQWCSCLQLHTSIRFAPFTCATEGSPINSMWDLVRLGWNHSWGTIIGSFYGEWMSIPVPVKVCITTISDSLKWALFLNNSILNFKQVHCVYIKGEGKNWGNIKNNWSKKARFYLLKINRHLKHKYGLMCM